VITLILVGAVLLLLETILPGMIAGILGVVCLGAGVIKGYTDFGTHTGNIILVGVIVGIVAGTLVWLRYFPSSRMAQIFISQRTVGEIGTEQPQLLGRTGAALTLLRPSGNALIDGRRVDVVTEGPPIEKGATVKVVAVEGLRVVVREV
jgi:membrane-bound serine protease (ClpP class)